MGFLFTLFIPALVVAGAWLAPLTPYPTLVLCVPLLLAYTFVPLVQAVIPWRPSEMSPDEMSPAWEAYFRVFPLLTLPLQLLMVAVALDAFVNGPFTTAGRAVLLVTTGLFGAIYAITVAHELMHRRQKFDRVISGLLLSTVSFGSFKVVHLQIHHAYVGTPLDFATARRGQSIYSFWLQSAAGNFLEAMRVEQTVAARSGKSAWTSELVGWSACSLLWLALAFAGWGWVGALFFVLQSVIAIMYLDCINYLQHYGLTRSMSDGRPEPMQDHHSWSQGLFFDDWLLFNLPRHAAHHVQPQRPFQLLTDAEGSPHYPLNYGLMTLAVLVPPLFRRLAHPSLDRVTLVQ